MRACSLSARASERGTEVARALPSPCSARTSPTMPSARSGSSGSMLPSCSPAATPTKNGPATRGRPPSPPRRSAVRSRIRSRSPSIGQGTVSARISKRPVACATNGRDQSKLVMSPARSRLVRPACAASSVPRVSTLTCRRCGSCSAMSASERRTRLASPATRNTSIGPRWWPRIRPENGRSTSGRTPIGPSSRAVPAAQKAERSAGATSLVSSWTVIAGTHPRACAPARCRTCPATGCRWGPARP